ncbi:MAG: hypothetical protein IKE91_02110 [Clostridia bacterium]|nr:hypothetical protein [Clostridia bacterium]
MDENNNKDVEKNVNETVQSNFTEESAPAKSGNKTKVIVISVIAVAVALLLIAGIVALVKNLGKPSKSQAKKVVESYLEAINDDDDDALIKLIDTDGYVILKEEKESKFDKKYKKKSSYVKDFMEDNNIDDEEELEDKITSNEGYIFGSSYEYSLKEITSVKKSSKSSKIAIIKAKVKRESSYSKDTETLTLYVIKSGGKYKVIGSKLS